MTDEAPANEDLAHADIGIVCALPMELAAFLDRCEKVRKYTGDDFVFRGGRYDGIRVAVAQCGLGFARARRATQALVDAHSPPWILSCGFSGGLVPNVHVGDIVMADSIVDEHGHALSIDLHLPNKLQPGLHAGRMLTADALVRHVDEKKALAAKHSAIAVDMESLAVAQVCRERNTRFLAVRVITDDLSADLPPEVLSLVGSSGTMRIGAALGAVWKRPGSIKEMWKLRESARHASATLADFLDGVVHQLYNALTKEPPAGGPRPA